MIHEQRSRVKPPLKTKELVKGLVMDRGPKCQRCWAYEEELDALRGIEVVLRLKYEDVEKLKQELERVTQEKEQLQTEVNAVKITLKKKDEQLSRSASVARKLEDNIAALRLENGNMLTTLHEAFRTRISKIDQVKTSTVVAAEKIKARPVARKPHVIDISEPEKNDQRIHNNDKDSRNAPVKTNKAKIYPPNLAPAAPPYPYGKQRKICLWESPGEKLCSQVFSSADQLGTHIRDFHVKELKNTNISCFWQGCALHGNKYMRKLGLRNHIIMHTGEQPYRCPHVGCNRVFSQSSKLKRHSYTHSREKNFTCSYPGCVKNFTRNDGLTQHWRLAHNIFQCNYTNCGKSYMSSAAFKAHLLAYHSSADFPCNFPDCDKIYLSKKQLQRHYLVHCKGKLFPCPECDKMFSSIRNLRVHQIVHPASIRSPQQNNDEPSYSNSVEQGHANTRFDSSGSSDSSDTGDSGEVVALELPKKTAISDTFSYQMVNVLPLIVGAPNHLSSTEINLSHLMI